jgi:hypothetical protein
MRKNVTRTAEIPEARYRLRKFADEATARRAATLDTERFTSVLLKKQSELSGSLCNGNGNRH